MKPIIAIIAAILLIGAGTWYFFTQRPSELPAGNEPVDTPQQETQSEGQVGIGDAPVGDAAYVAGNLVLGVDTGALGPHLIGYNGMTLYTFTKDTVGVSNCSGACAANWPPYTVPSLADLANIQAGINGKVSSVTRADGSHQVTYNGMPLYFYIKDAESGDTTGQGVGSAWYVVQL